MQTFCYPMIILVFNKMFFYSEVFLCRKAFFLLKLITRKKQLDFSETTGIIKIQLNRKLSRVMERALAH
jgi:hypothetical protein